MATGDKGTTGVEEDEMNKGAKEATGVKGDDENEKGATKATKDGEEDIPKVQQDEKPQMVKTGKRRVKDDETPLPEGFYEKEDEEIVHDDDDEAEDRVKEGPTRSSKDVIEVTLKVGDAKGEALAKGQTAGKAEAGSEEQSPGKPSPKTQRKVKVKGTEDEISPIVQRMVNEEVEKRLKAQPSLTRRLFHEDNDEEDAKRQYGETMKQMRQASERMRKLKAEKDAKMKEQFETRVKEELEKKRREESQRIQKKLWMEEYEKELKMEKRRQLEQRQKEQMEK